MKRLKKPNTRTRLRIAAKLEIVLTSKAEQLDKSELPAFYESEIRRCYEAPRKYINHMLLVDWPRYRDKDWLLGLVDDLSYRSRGVKMNGKVPLSISYIYLWTAISISNSGQNVTSAQSDFVHDVRLRFNKEFSKYVPRKYR